MPAATAAYVNTRKGSGQRPTGSRSSLHHWTHWNSTSGSTNTANGRHQSSTSPGAGFVNSAWNSSPERAIDGARKSGQPSVTIWNVTNTHASVKIRRATPPLQGQWSLPGGKIGWGETAHDAALRELREETGVEAEIVGLIDVVDAIFPASVPTTHFLLVDYAAVWRSGEPKAGDDAADAAFFPLADALVKVTWDETRRIIAVGVKLIDLGSAVHQTRLARNFAHELVHELQLLERRPAGITLPPAAAGREPHRKSLGEVFKRMGLRVPHVQVQHVALAVRPRLVVIGIGY